MILVDARPVPAYVALGANLGDARRTVRQAVQDLGRLPQTRLVRVSSLYRTAPVDSSGPDYINAVAEVATSLTPHALLAELQRLELAAGRERPYLNAPRTLDLDILLYDDLTLDSPTLTIPHPRMATRAFVLVPLTEIAPQLLGAELLEAVRGQVIERLPED